MLYLIHERKGYTISKPFRGEAISKRLGFSSEGLAMTRLSISLSISIASVALLPPSAQACSVPVFKYALTYWHVDLYEVIAFHRGLLSLEEQAVVDRIQKAFWNADLLR